MTEKNYATKLVNATKEPLMVYEETDELVEIQPGQSFDVESRNPATMYARWSQVTWHEGGRVTFVSRPGFVEPERGRWTIKLLNQDGRSVEKRMVGGRMINLPKNIPVVVGLKLDDPLVKYKSLTIVTKRVPVRDEEHIGYLLFETIDKDELEEREASDLKALEKLLTEKS